MKVAREQISLKHSLELVLQFAPGKKKLQIEVLQKFFPRFAIREV